MKKIVLILILSSVIALALPISAAAFSLVPCGRSDQVGTVDEHCQLGHLFILIVRMINYLISLAAVVAIYFVLNAGFGMVLAMGNPEKIQTNKESIKNAVVGFAIVILAFIFINLLVNGIFGTSSTSKKWWDPSCLYNITNTANGCPRLQFGGDGTGIGGPSGPPPGPSGNLTDLAAAILANTSGNITLDTRADWGAPFHARQNIVDMSQGLFPAVCTPRGSPPPGCITGGVSGTVTVNPAILSNLLDLAQSGTRFMITSLTTGMHSANSDHYRGEAVDIAPAGTAGPAWFSPRDYLNRIGGTAFCESPSGVKLPTCGGADHIHWTLPYGAVGVSVAGLCTGSICADTGRNVCGAVMPSDGCFESPVNDVWSQRIAGNNIGAAEICPGVNTEKILKSIMANESDGGRDLTSFDNSSFGLFHMKPSTANIQSLKDSCGITANIDQAWLLNLNNAAGQACLAAGYLRTLVSPCGCDVRQLAAGYNGGASGAGACAPSTDCGAGAQGGACDVCAGQNRPTKRWECLWDDRAHLTCNAAQSGGGYAQTRVYAPAVEACYGRF